MIYKDTRDDSVKVSFKTAVLEGMNQKTGGLYVPEFIPKLTPHFLTKYPSHSFREIALEMSSLFIGDEIPKQDLQSIIIESFPFNAQIVPLDPTTYVLELFHGPTCAFKDFGARFMARCMAYFNKEENRELHILVATSGDTGSAVGSAFHNMSGISVTILYPKGKISALQEKQLSTFTNNVHALAIDGTFDDCQKMVKRAFTDKSLRKNLNLSSANSINIARLIPQSFYHMYASLVVFHRSALDNKIENPLILITVPSGNFGNLTSGFMAYEMGAPVSGFIAATNSNRTIPDWLATGNFKPRPSVSTISNAMDVGNPSNFERLLYMYDIEKIRKILASYWATDEMTIDAIRNCNTRTGYIIDPHAATAWQAWTDIRKNAMEDLLSGTKSNYKKPGLTPNIPIWAQCIQEKKAVNIILETAHPAKFGETVKEAIGRDPVIPDRLRQVMSKPDNSISMKANYADLKEWLLNSLK
ncbi:MAG: threonine synthase [Treponemataceae bacterium]